MSIYPGLWFITFSGVIIPMTTFNAYKSFVLTSCDPKFGCVGTFQFSLFILSICAVISSCTLMFVYRFIAPIKKSKRLLYTCFIIGILLSFLSNYIFHANSVFLMISGWFLLSFVMSWVGLLTNRI